MTDKITQLEELLKAQPGDSFLTHALALEYRKIGDFEKSSAYFQQNLDTYPDYLGTYHAYGQLLEQNNHIQKAIEMYAQGLTIAKKLGDQKTFNELQSAIDWIED